VTGNAREITRLIEPHVARVVVVSPTDTGIRSAPAKTDRLDARTLARLIASGELDAVWMPDRATWVMRRPPSTSRPAGQGPHPDKGRDPRGLMRCLVGRPPFADPFGVKGRRWLIELALPEEEREAVDSALRQVEFLDSEIAAVERPIATEALASAEIRRLMTVPGVNVVCAATFMAAATSAASRARATWSATSGSTPGSASRARARREAGGSRSGTRCGPATPWSRRAGRRSAGRVRSGPSTSGSAPAAATRSRSSPRRASSPACSGPCSAASRTTPTRSHP